MKANQVNRSLTLPLAADSILTDMARERGISVNEFGRRALEFYAEALKLTKAFAFKAAMDAHGRQFVACAACAIFIFSLELQSWFSKDQDEFRSAKRSARIVRCTRVKGREIEIA